MNHINVSKYIYYRQDDVRLSIARQIESRVVMSEGPGQPHSGLAIPKKQTNKHKTSLNIANFMFSKKYVFEEERGFLVPK